MRRDYMIAMLVLVATGPLQAAEDKALVGREAVATAKERLGSKAADPQRVNDCNVPADKRNLDRVRPSDCSHLKRGIRSDAADSDD